MKKVKINIGSNSYNVQLVETEEQREKGLQGVKDLPDNEGMLFIFDDSDEVSMWMKNTPTPLDLIFIDEDLAVKAVHQGVPESEEVITENDIAYVLELNINSGVKAGNELEFSPHSKVKSEKMAVLDSEGIPQMELEGGERIFSRANTKTLIKFAKKAASTGRDKDYIALGKRVFKFIGVQEENEPEYVESK